MATPSSSSSSTNNVTKNLGIIDKFLWLWILLSMALGLLISYYVPTSRTTLNATKILDVSLPIFIGLLWMMYPVLCKVKYEELPQLFKSKNTLRNLGLSMSINWVIAPLLMTGLAWACLPDLPNYRNGVILVGVARCIAMVLIWNQLADGDPEWCAILVAINALLQLFLFSPLAYFYTVVISGGSGNGEMVDIWLVTRSVLVFLGVPLLAGMITRLFLRFGTRKYKWYDESFMPLIGPTALIGLLFTIVVMFILQGSRIINDIGSVFRVAVPLVLYFSIVFFGVYIICRMLKIPYDIAVTQSFTASGNNFELAIAVAVASYGIESQEALATVIGPLIEVPVLLVLVHCALASRAWYEKIFNSGASTDPEINQDNNIDNDGEKSEPVGLLAGQGTKSDDTIISDAPRVMFLCRHNSARSQMAHGFLNQYSSFHGKVESSGLLEKTEVNPLAIKVMNDIQIDLSNYTSNHINEYNPQSFDIVVSMCGCSASVPVEWSSPSIVRFEDWNLPDPKTEQDFISVRDEIQSRVREFVDSIVEKRTPTYSLYTITDSCLR